jgi:hypothetical protein
MKKLALGALLTGTAVACFSCGGGDTQLLDASVDAGLICNPMLQTGCMAGEKCTWVVDVAGPMQLGHVDCVPDGTVARGDNCNAATAGGADNCVAGNLCISGQCKPICDPQLVEGSAAGACPINFACSLYEGFFESGGVAIAGVCEPACDPLTQRLKVGTTNIEACGSINPAQPSATCIRGPGYRSFACAPTNSTLYAKTDREEPLLSPGGGPYPNGCAPGFMPFYFEDASGSMKTLCSGMCAPLKVDSTIVMDLMHQDDNRGDKMALGKLPSDAAPVIGHSTCDVNVKGSAVDNPRGEDCRFLWYSLAEDGDPGKAITTPYNDTLGFCFPYEKFFTIPVPGSMTRLPEKSCAELPEVSPSPSDLYGSAKEWGCYPLSESMTPRRTTRRVVNYRVANGDVSALRHVFD